MMQSFKIQNFLLALVLAIFSFGIYANSFNNQMFWDDNDFILNNQYVKNFDLKNIFSENIVAGSGLQSNYYRPVLSTVFAFEWQFWQDSRIGWHIVNTSFHALDGIILFFILLYIFQKRWLAFFASVIFIVHPLQTEAVVYVNSLGDSLSVFWMFLGILLYLKFRYSGKPFYASPFFWLAILMYPLALFSKETAIIMPALLFAADYFAQITTERKFNFVTAAKQKLIQAFKYLWPFFLISLLYVLLRGTVLNFGSTFNLYGEENYFTTHFLARIFTFFKALAAYIGLVFFPANQHMERTMSIATSLFSIPVILGLVVFASLLFLAFKAHKRFPELSLGSWWFLIAIAPVSNIAVPINGLVYEHWLYVPLIGIAVGMVWMGQNIVLKKPSLLKPSLALLAIITIALSAKTILRNQDWRDPITFYSNVMQYTSDSYRVINNLGMAYDDAHQQEKAKEMYQKAISINPENPVAYHNLANTNEHQGQYDLAEQNFKKALSLDPNFFFSVNGLIKLYLSQNKPEQAQALAQQYGYQLNLGN